MYVTGYLLNAAVTHQQAFDYRPGELFGCVADIGWITGHSYVVYGPLCNGGTRFVLLINRKKNINRYVVL